MALKLSICVPSRNRQIYFQETIRALLSSPRDDVEFVFADNSDDPAIMNTFMEAQAADPRVVFLPSQPRVLSMIDNWERTVAASTGDWITVIGDDDYLDPELAGLLSRLVAVRPDLEAFDWKKLHFMWPTEADGLNFNIALNGKSHLTEISPALTRRRAWHWEDATFNLVSGFSIYHAALSRSLIETIKTRFCGRYFEHPTVDFDSALKVSLVADVQMTCDRPFSVLGACPLSNSGSLHSLEKMRQRSADFMRELGRNLDDDPELADFPFLSSWGTAAVVGQVQHWIRRKYGLKHEGWEKRFAECCARGCETLHDRDYFDVSVSLYQSGFKVWHQGKYARFFNPVYQAYAGGPDNAEPFSGHRNGEVYMSLKLLNPRTPAELFEVVSAFYPDAADIDLTWTNLY